MGSSNEWPDPSGNVALNPGVCPRPVPMPDDQDPAIDLGFSARTLHFALFPLPSRHPLATAARLNGQEQVRERVSNRKWHHKDLAETIGIIFVQLF